MKEHSWGYDLEAGFHKCSLCGAFCADEPGPSFLVDTAIWHLNHFSFANSNFRFHPGLTCEEFQVFQVMES